jgi:hypothetical protein
MRHSYSPPSCLQPPSHLGSAFMCEFTDRLNRQSVWLAILAIALGVWGLTDIRARARIDPQNPGAHRSDLTVNTAAGAAIFNGQDPYAVANIRGWHYHLPPLFAIIVAPLSGLDSQLQGIVWYAISLLALWGCYTESRRIWFWLHATNNSTATDTCSTGPFDSSSTNGGGSKWVPASKLFYKSHRLQTVPVYIFWLAGATVLLPILNCLQRGQLGIAVTYLLLLGFRCVVTSRTMTGALRGGIILTLPVVIKVIPALPVAVVCLLFLAIASHQHFAVAPVKRGVGVSMGTLVGLLLFLFVIPSLAIGPIANAKHLKTWLFNILPDEQGKFDDDFGIHALRNQSLSNAFYRFGNMTAHVFGGAINDRTIDDTDTRNAAMPMDHPWVNQALRVFQLGLLVLLFGAGWSAARSPDPWTIASIFALACLLMSAISPIFRGHYYVLWLPAAWIVPVYAWQNGSQRLAVVLSISACVLTWIHYLLLPSAGRLGVLGLGATIWYVVATISVLRAKPIARGESVQTNPELRYAA